MSSWTPGAFSMPGKRWDSAAAGTCCSSGATLLRRERCSPLQRGHCPFRSKLLALASGLSQAAVAAWRPTDTLWHSVAISAAAALRELCKQQMQPLTWVRKGWQTWEGA